MNTLGLNNFLKILRNLLRKLIKNLFFSNDNI
jgi:hypothetical protein